MDNVKDWPENSVKIVKRTLIDNEIKVRLQTAGKNIKYTTSSKITDEFLVITYYKAKKCFVIWNACVHKIMQKNRTRINFEVGELITHQINNKMNENKIIKFYKKSKCNNTMNQYEIITVVGERQLFEFCDNFYYYIIPNIEDENYMEPTIISRAFSNEEKECDYRVEREIEAVYRKKRDSLFRKKILEKYNNRCVICGERDEGILQAAHINSVANGGSDDLSNGICLCANHHILYDKGLIDFNFSNESFMCSSQLEKRMNWYKQAEKRNFKLYL